VPRQQEIAQEFMDRIRQHQGILHKILAVYSEHSADREDLKQEMILQLWRSYSSFKGRSAFSTWMYRVALNTAITFTRKINFYRRHTEDLSAVDNCPQSVYSEDLQLLYRAISQLNKVEKAIILMWLNELPYREIAETLGITEKNVSVRIVRIKGKLAKLIKKLQ
jgi:RNA polymerase sigma-70 factor (ECF subfamily)